MSTNAERMVGVTQKVDSDHFVCILNPMSSFIASFVHGLLENIERKAHNDQEYHTLLFALHHSLGINVGIDLKPPSVKQIVDSSGLSISTLVEHKFVLNKNEAVQFMRFLGDYTSPNLLKKKTLKEGRYRERFDRELATHAGANVYTFAELVMIMNRPHIAKLFKELVQKHVPTE